MQFTTIYGVDFSGAKLAGRNIWIAEAATSQEPGVPPLRLVSLSRLEALAGTAERAAALGHLVGQIAASREALWCLDFPFGFPVEIFPAPARLADQLEYLRAWDGEAYRLGLECVRRAKALGGQMHIRRETDRQMKTPFDCYHYRIIYQSFHGMRDVLLPLWRARETAIVPFQYRKLPAATRVLVEACPGSTLKRLGLPHQNYKQATGGPLTAKRRRTRRAIVDALAPHLAFDARQRGIMMRNPGGDALDAVIAAVGGHAAWAAADHRAIARHPRYAREGRLFA